MARTKTRRIKRWVWTASAATLTTASMAVSIQAYAVTFSTMNGAPVQMQPYVDEPGAPTVTVPVGTPQPFMPPASTADSSGGATAQSGSSEALTTMLGTTWGSGAVEIAQATGVNPSALASVCVAETTSCNSSATNGSFRGAFQMGPAAFSDGLNAALAKIPSLAAQIVSGPAGRDDPLTQATAETGYMLLGAKALQAVNIANPTALDYRSFQNFGPTYGVQVAQADGNTRMADILPNSYLAGNGISSQQTVAQWRSAVANKIGSAATQPLLQSGA